MTDLKNPEPSEPNTQTPQQSPGPDPALKRLDVFVGKWNTEGQIRAAPPNPAVKISGTDIYEWLPGGFFLVHRVDVRMGDEEVKAVEIIGYDASSQTYPMHSFDNKGNYDLLQANVHDRTWTIIGKSMRFTGVFSDDGNTITGHWEQLIDGSNWLPWMEVKLTRVEDLTGYPFDTGSTAQNREKKVVRLNRDAAGSYASVNGLNMYYEVHGAGRPLILLHGGVGASEMFNPVLPKLVENRQVITVHLQGHGHTRDIDRPLRYEFMADDIAALIAHLGFDRADLMGYSMGGGVALQTAIRHPEVVGKLVVISEPMRRNGWYPEVLVSLNQMAANATQLGESLKKSPLAELYPNADWERIFTKVGDMESQDYDWSDDVVAIKSPMMIIFADADAIITDHIVEFYKLLGGCQLDAGLDGSHRPIAQLAILPGTTHYDILSFPALADIVMRFLDEPVPKAK